MKIKIIVGAVALVISAIIVATFSPAFAATDTSNTFGTAGTSALPITPQALDGSYWAEVATTELKSHFTGNAEITHLETFDDKIWAFGYGGGTFQMWSFALGSWSNATPAGFDVTHTTAISASAVIGNTLFIGTTSDDGYAQIWNYTVADGWSQDTDFPAQVDSVSEISGSSTDFYCAATYFESSPAFYCTDGSWEEINQIGLPTNFSLSTGHAQIIAAEGSLLSIINYSVDAEDVSEIFIFNGDEGMWSSYPNAVLTGSDQWANIAFSGDGIALMSNDWDTGVVRLFGFDAGGGTINQIGGDNFDETGTFSATTSHILNSFPFFSVVHDDAAEMRIYGFSGYVTFGDATDFLVDIDGTPTPSNTINDFVVTENTLFVSTSLQGEGSFKPSVWVLFQGDSEETTTTTTTPAVTDSDNDGISDAIENAAPNNGDGNGDGTLDSEQSNVTSFVGTNGKYVTVVSPEGTTISSATNAPESSQSAQDSAYDYSFGLTNFTVTGVSPGATIEMKLYFASSEAAAKFVARKLSGTTYSTLEGSSLLNVIVGSNTPAVKLTYGIQDNGPLDTNATAGAITDPVGLGSVGTLPATGSNAANQWPIALVLLTAGCVLLFVGRKRKALFA